MKLGKFLLLFLSALALAYVFNYLLGLGLLFNWLAIRWYMKRKGTWRWA